jgi:hypothetical protein
MTCRVSIARVRLTPELTHAEPKDVVREAELEAPSGVVCSDLVRRLHELKR